MKKILTILFVIFSFVIIFSEILEIHFIDVGQGDAIFINHPDFKMLIDAGDRFSPVSNYLASLGIEEIDIVVATHPHADHIAGLVSVLRRFEVKEVFDSGLPYTTVTFQNYLLTIYERKIEFTEARAGMHRDISENFYFEILHPSDPLLPKVNDVSIVIRMVYDEVSFLFMGDAETSSEYEIMERYDDITSNVIKIGHHGSRTSSREEFLISVSPEIAVVQCGLNNRYGHPHTETIQTLEKFEIPYYITANHGTIIMITDGKTIEIETEKIEETVE
jgi:competence protein ComEC